MVNIMQSLYTAYDALSVNQSAMGIVSNNIANMNTEGYSKQRLDTQSVTYKSGTDSQYVQVQPGTVSIETVQRYQDELLNNFIIQEKAKLGYDAKDSEIMQMLEGFFNELEGTGLTGALNDYFSAAQDLANNPTDLVVRANFVAQAENVADNFNSKYSQLTSYRESLVGDSTTISSLNNSEIGLLTSDINSKLEQITEINSQINVLTTQQGTQPNSLLDQRQLLLEELSEQIPISTRIDGHSMSVYIGNVELISDGVQLAELNIALGDTSNPAVVSIVGKDDPSLVFVTDYTDTFSKNEGELKNLLDMGGDDSGSILYYINQLNSLAQEFASNVNDVQINRTYAPGPVLTEASFKMDSATGQLAYATEYIFLNADTPTPYDPLTITAENISINQAVKDDPYEIATAYGAVATGLTDPDDPAAVGNNNNALAFASMRDSGISGLNNTNIEDFYYQMMTEIGNEASLANDQLESQSSSVTYLTEKKQSIIGVSLDEELIDLMKYQKAYEASSRVMSTVNDMLSIIINMGS